MLRFLLPAFLMVGALVALFAGAFGDWQGLSDSWDRLRSGRERAHERPLPRLSPGRPPFPSGAAAGHFPSGAAARQFPAAIRRPPLHQPRRPAAMTVTGGGRYLRQQVAAPSGAGGAAYAGTCVSACRHRPGAPGTRNDAATTAGGSHIERTAAGPGTAGRSECPCPAAPPRSASGPCPTGIRVGSAGASGSGMDTIDGRA